MSPWHLESSLFALLAAGGGRLALGTGSAAGCWSWGGTEPGLERPGLSPAAFAGGFPDWAGFHAGLKCRCCTHLPRSALWRCNYPCQRSAEKDQAHLHYNTILYCIHLMSSRNDFDYVDCLLSPVFLCMLSLWLFSLWMKSFSNALQALFLIIGIFNKTLW